MASCTNTSSSESTFFVEKEEVLGLISTLSSHDSTSSSYSAGAPAIESSSNLSSTQQESNLSEDAALSKVRAILDKYLECPTLLDPYLEVMVRKLSLPAREIIHELFLRQCQRRDFETNLNCSDAAYERDNKFFDGTSPKQGEGDKFQANHLSPIELIESNKKLDTLIHLLSAIYSLSKVRGRKYISRLLPHDVADVEPVLAALRWFGWLDERARNMDFIQDVSSLNDTSGGTDGGFESNSAIIVPEEMQHFYLHLQQQKRRKRNSDLEAKPWESVHSLLTWLSIISLVPFDLSTIDSTLVCHRFCDAAGHNIRSDDTRGKHSSMTLVQSILTTSASHLTDTGPTRETAAACMASLLSRPDLDKFELERFMYWCCGILIWFRTGERAGGGNLERIGFENCSKSSSNQTFLPMPDQTPNIFLVMGTIQTLAAIFKTGHRSNMLSSQQTFRGIELLWEQAIIIAEGSESGSRSMGGTIVLRKLLVKLFARLGCAYLPPRVAAWRYQRGKRSLVENLMKGSAATNTTTANNKNKDTFCDHGADSSVESGLFPVPDQVEDAMDQLLRSLTDPSTIVRWSAAKGIGRLTERLPAICADDVLDALLQTCSDPERDRAWHGTCLALAELARRGLLLPQRLGQVVPIVIQAIRYDVRRGQHSVGAHVRDAACYTCWAFARAYAPSVLKPHVRDLSVALVLASLFDREVNCRRAASAAFQESVGRQGADNFKHGIAILTTADYYSLGNRTDAFMKSALDIAEFEEYQTQIIDHLSESKLIHWDIEIRVLASKSLSRISKLNPSYCEMRILPALLERCFSDDLVVRHGSLLGCAEMVLAFGELDLFRSDDFVRDGVKLSIADLVPSIEKARLYRGRGGEIMRGAACRMIECIALASISLTVKQQVRLLDSIDACLVHPNESIQNSAAKALNALLTHYFPVSSNGPSARLQNRVVDKYISAIKTDDNPAATRGFSLALGALPAKLLAPSGEVLNSVLTCLSEASRKEALVGGESDAETRRNSIISLVNICKTVGIGTAHASKGDSFPIYPLTTTQTKFVFGTLLAAMDDYNTDRRGDVGSWSRIAAMNGLETLAYLAVGATSALSHRDEDAYTLTQKTDLENIDPIDVPLLPDCRSSAKEKPNDVRLYFDEKTCHAMFSALLKQLGEKLDAVRSEAGGCLERLLTCDSPRVPFVPNRDMLIKSLAVEKPKNWSNPAHTFPLLMSAINIDEYLEPILSGVVISVGGLTESVSKSSSAALFEWIKSLRIAGETRKLNEMGRGCFFTVFIRMFQQYKRNGRVLLPLLSTLDKLLFHGSLDELLCNEQNMFLTDLLMRLSSESKGCTDVKRLLAIVGVTVNLLQPHLNNVMKMRHDIIRLLLVLLLNRYPRVRRYTAEQLYVKLLEDGTALFNDNQQVDRASHLLLNVVWHEEHDPFGQILESRNMIADLLDVPLSTEERNAKIGIRQAAIIPEEDFASYSALVSSTS